MFEQVIGDGANIFIIIVAVIIGFGVAMGYVDFLKTRKNEEGNKH
jgi:phosphotransferase system  glucose/maltose/N-acetylglucosamine-specific IIC component